MSVSETEPINVGLIGLGNSGWYYHAQATLENSSDFRISAVNGRRPASTQAGAQRFSAHGHNDWHDLVADDTVDLVVVATPHDLHAPMAIEAMNAGKHVVVEKPMAITRVECDAMITAAQRNGRVLSVFHNRRWEPSFQIITEMMKAGELGEVWRTETRRMHRGKYAVAGSDSPHTGSEPATWAHTGNHGGGVTYLIAPHLIDHQLLLHGAPSSVSAIMHRYPNDDVEHYLDLNMDFGHAQARIELFREIPFDLPKWSVFGSRGTVVCPDFGTLIHHRADGSVREYSDLPTVQGCNEFYEQLAQSIRRGAQAPVRAQDGAAVVQVLQAAHQSAAQAGAAVSFE